jgi:polysaccharide export outer membrane protein
MATQNLGFSKRLGALVLTISIGSGLAGCSTERSSGTDVSVPVQETSYLIGPGDKLSVFVWQNPDLSVNVPVRPDGRISLPLLQDVVAAQMTPAQLADEIEQGLSAYLQEPHVTVIVTDFVGSYSQQVRVVGEAAEPKAIPYRNDMSVLDVVIAVGGLTQFAAGNRAVIVRKTAQQRQELAVRLDDLIKDGDMSADVPILPGDVLVIPQSWF